MHSGIHTELVVTGELNIEKGIYGEIIGDAINLASRLSDLAQSGEILVGPETHRRTQGAFTSQTLGSLHLPGKAAPHPGLSGPLRQRAAHPLPPRTDDLLRDGRAEPGAQSPQAVGDEGDQRSRFGCKPDWRGGVASARDINGSDQRMRVNCKAFAARQAATLLAACFRAGYPRLFSCNRLSRLQSRMIQNELPPMPA